MLFWVWAVTAALFAFVIPFGAGTYLYQQGGMGSQQAGNGVLLMGAGFVLGAITFVTFAGLRARRWLRRRARARAKALAQAQAKPAATQRVKPTPV